MIRDEFIYNTQSSKVLEKGSFTWKAPSNIALVKYWGKRDVQIPENPSLSFTLSNCFTETTLEFTKQELDHNSISLQNIDFDIYFEGQKKDSFKPKIDSFFQRILEFVPFISHYTFVIKTHNSFPHSSGIASSASGMAALALCIMSMEKALNPAMSEEFYYKKASLLARLGSGSAARSVKGELVVWGATNNIEGSSNLFGLEFPYKIHDNFKNYQDVILLVDKGEKVVSSTVGHNLMHGHPFAEKRFEQANDNLVKLSEILQNGDLKSFVNLVESEALSLHAMMMTSNPYFILMKPNTLQIIHKIWHYRSMHNSDVCFTLDAGANVHVLFPENEKQQVANFIKDELAKFCQNGHYISDHVGQGAVLIER